MEDYTYLYFGEKGEPAMFTRIGNATRVNDCEDVFSVKQALLLSLITVLFALALPLSTTVTPLSDFLFWSICLVFGILVLLTSKRFSSIIILGLTLTFFASYTGSAASVALIVGTVSACGVYSALTAQAHKWEISLLVLIPAVAFGSAFALTGNVIMALSPLTIFLPSLAMGLILRRGGSRVSAIAGFASVATVEIGAVALILIYLQNGYLSFEAIGDAASYFRVVTEEFFSLAIETAGESAITDDVALMVADMAAEMTNLLLGLTCASIITAGFFAQKIQHALFERFELETLQNQSGAPIKASVTAAIVYAAAYICSFTTGASSAPSFVATAAANISLILLPLLLCVGFGFMTSLPKRIGFLALVAWLGAASVAYLLSSSLIDIIALVGAFYTLLVNVDTWAEEHYSKGGDQ